MMSLVRLFFTIFIVLSTSKNTFSMHSQDYHQLYELLLKHEFDDFSSKLNGGRITQAESHLLHVQADLQRDLDALTNFHLAAKHLCITPDIVTEELLVALFSQNYPSLWTQENISADEYYAIALTLAEYYILDDNLDIAQFILSTINLSNNNDPLLHARKYKLWGDIHAAFNLLQQAEGAYTSALAASKNFPTLNYLISLNLADLYTNHDQSVMAQATLETITSTNQPHLAHLYKLSSYAHRLNIKPSTALSEDYENLQEVSLFFMNTNEFTLRAKTYALLGQYAERLKDTEAAERYNFFAKDIANKNRLPALLRQFMHQEYEETAQEKIEIIRQRLHELKTHHPVYDAPTQPLSPQFPADGGVFVGE